VLGEGRGGLERRYKAGAGVRGEQKESEIKVLQLVDYLGTKAGWTEFFNVIPGDRRRREKREGGEQKERGADLLGKGGKRRVDEKLKIKREWNGTPISWGGGGGPG